ncbi:hypothetical protein FACS18949_12960 [Clostridia bacterium]|nr:hypothetical protein FACS189425_04350 [Clostridia bacterium]GHV35294.1 hypothetical protein FACS18949_12960 [Clostridia bacterium]
MFKTLLTHPDAEPLLKFIISGVLGLDVVSVTVRNNELPISDAYEKQERFDVNCVLDDGTQVEIEMQVAPMIGDNTDNKHELIRNRSVLYLCDLHSSQPARGLPYSDLVRSYQLTFCGYTVFGTRNDYINRFTLRNNDGDELTDAINVVFVELSKLDAALKKPVENMTSAEMLGVFLKYADDERYQGKIREMAAVKEEIQLANQILTSISTDEDERARFRARRKWQHDQDSDKIMSFREGKAAGKAEGKLEEKAEVARQLLAIGMSVEQASAVTKLTVTEIQALKNQ